MAKVQNQHETWQKRRLQHQLEVQSMQIERVLDQHQLAAQVAGGTVRPRSIRFDLQTQLATGLERLRDLKSDLMVALGVADVELLGEEGQLSVQVERTAEAPVPLLDLLPLIGDVPPVTAVLGLAEDKRPLLLNFLDKDLGHILVAGADGAGKTTLLRTIALSLALTNRQSRLQMVIIHPETADSPATDLTPLNYLPHLLTQVVTAPTEATEVLAFLAREMEYRLEQTIATPTIVLLADCVVNLLETGGEAIVKSVTQLLQKGAEAGIHLILSTRRPGAAVFSQAMHAYLPVRIVGQVADEKEAKAAAGVAGVKADYLLGSGDFLAGSDDEFTRFQAAYIGDYDLHLCLSELHRQRPRVLLAQSAKTRPTLDGAMMNGGVAVPTSAPAQPFRYNGRGVEIKANKLVDLGPIGDDEAELRS